MIAALLVLAVLAGPHPEPVRVSHPIDISSTPSVRMSSWEAFGTPADGLLVRACFRSELSNGYDAAAADDLVLGKLVELGAFAIVREGGEIPGLSLVGVGNRGPVRVVDHAAPTGALRAMRAFERDTIVACFASGTGRATADVSKSTLEGVFDTPPRPSLALRVALAASRAPHAALASLLAGIAALATWIVVRRPRPAF